METQNEIIRGYIYKITNIANGMCYIGKTTYKDIQKRFAQHKTYALVAKGGTEKTVHQAIRDFGIDNFKIEEIEIVKAPEFLENRERYWIAYYHSWIGDPECNGYNQSRGGEGTHYSSTEFSDYLSDKIISLYEQVQNQQEVSRQLGIDPTTVRNYLYLNNIAVLSSKEVAIKETGKKVAVYDGDNLIAIFPSIGQVIAHMNNANTQDTRHVSEICHGGNRKYLHGYSFQFTDEEIFNNDIILTYATNYIPGQGRKMNGIRKPVKMINPETNEVIQIFNSLIEAGKFLNPLTPKSGQNQITIAIKNNKLYKNYKWEYANSL